MNKDIFEKSENKISSSEIKEKIQEIEKEEQLYSIALFDILGFSNFVQTHGTDIVLELYQKLVDLIHKMEPGENGYVTFSGSVVPVPISPDCKHNQLVADANGYIRVGHFSDTFLIYTNYLIKRQPFWLADSYYEENPLLIMEANTKYNPLIIKEHSLYISFLQVCMEFFCEAIRAGIPLRGCVATGMAIMNKHDSIFLGEPLVEAARGEPAQNAIGIAFGRSFNNYHPIYNRYFIPYLKNIKENDIKAEFLSPMMLDWPRFWRHKYASDKPLIEDYISKMNDNPKFSKYYDNAIKFAEFSEEHENWSNEIDREGMTDIIDYYKRVKKWYLKQQ